MSANNSDTTDSTAQFDQFVQNLSDEAVEAVEQISQTIEKAATAADEVTDVAGPVVEALSDLSKGDRAGAVNAVLGLFDDQTRNEIAEARAACLAFLASGKESAAEVDDVVDMVAQQAAEVAEALDVDALADRLRSALNL